MTALARALAGSVKGAAAAGLKLAWGQVSAVHTAPNRVDVKLRGSSTATTGLLYDATYTPTVGDTVYLLEQGKEHGGPDYVVLGKTA